MTLVAAGIIAVWMGGDDASFLLLDSKCSAGSTDLPKTALTGTVGHVPYACALALWLHVRVHSMGTLNNLFSSICF